MNSKCNFIFSVALVCMAIGSGITEKHRSVLNIGMLIFGLGYLYYIWKNKGVVIPAVSWRPLIPVFLCIVLFIAPCFLHHESWDDAFFLLRKHINWFPIAAIFFIGPRLSQKMLARTLYAFAAFCLWVDVQTLYNYIDLVIIRQGEGLHPTWLNLIDMLYDKIIPFGLYHHTLSVYNFFCILMMYVLSQKNDEAISELERKLIWICMSFVFAFLHFLSARIGLLMVYCFLFSVLLKQWNLLSKPLKYLILISFVMFVSLAIGFIPTLHNKLLLTYRELLCTMNLYKIPLEEFPNLRIKHQLVGMKHASRHILWGLGYQKFYHLGINPHNMYIFYTIVMGLPVLILFLLSQFSVFVCAGVKWCTPLLFFTGMHLLYSNTDNGFDLLNYLNFYGFWSAFLIHFCKVWDS